jgi:hypothetical protein
MHVLEAALFANLIQQPRKTLADEVEAEEVAARWREADQTKAKAEEKRAGASGRDRLTAAAALIAALTAQSRRLLARRREAAAARRPA